MNRQEMIAPILDALRVLHEPDTLIEVRGLAVDGNQCWGGRFLDPVAAANAALRLSGRSKGVYVTLNPIMPELGELGLDRARVDQQAADRHILRRRWMLVDIEAQRPDKARSNASNQELEHTRAQADQITTDLAAAGWPAPVLVMSGNGWHLLYRIDLPADDRGLVRQCLRALAARYPSVDIDTTVHNPSRITKLPGTLARKAPEAENRPHRLAELVEEPCPVEVVPTALLEQLAAQAPLETPLAPASLPLPSEHQEGRPGAQERARAWLAKRDPAVSGQGGDTHTFRTAAKLVVDFGLADDQALALILEWNQTCVPPWTEAELRQKIRSARRSGSHPLGAALAEDSSSWRYSIRQAAERAGVSTKTLYRAIQAGDLKAQFEDSPHSSAVRAGFVSPADLAEWLQRRPGRGVGSSAAPRGSGGHEGHVHQGSGGHEGHVYQGSGGHEGQGSGGHEGHVHQGSGGHEGHVHQGSGGHEGHVHQGSGGHEETGADSCSLTLPGYQVPDNYQIKHDGVFRTKWVREELVHEPVLPAPLLVSGVLTDELLRQHVHLTWWHDPLHLSRKIVTRDQLAQASELVKLSAYGLPVDSNTSKAVVRYLSETLAANVGRLPEARLTGRLGWQAGKREFLAGRLLIQAGDVVEVQDLDYVPPEEWKPGQLVFRGHDTGSEQLADCYGRTAGTRSEWLATVNKIRSFPRVLLALFASLAPVLLEPLEAPSFVVDWAGPTSAGKSTALKLAASVWGNPGKGATSMIQAWDVTRTWVEGSMAVLNGLPLILDDTARARNPEDVSRIVYDVESGRTRGRGTRAGGLQAGLSFRLLLLSTGEARIVDLGRKKDGGQFARALCLWGSPFGKQDPEIRAFVMNLTGSLLENYGFAGKEFVQFVLQQKPQWPEWRARFRRLTAEFVATAGTDPVAGRYAEYLALLSITAELAARSGCLPWSEMNSDPIQSVWAELRGQASEADRAREALQAAYDWACANPQAFWSRYGSDRGAPFTGWLGLCDRSDDGLSVYRLSFVKHRLRDFLENQGFQPESTLRLWRDKGFLLTEEGRHDKVERGWNGPQRLVCVSPVGLRELGVETGALPGEPDLVTDLVTGESLL